MVAAALAERMFPDVSKRVKHCAFANRSVPWRDTWICKFEVRAKSADRPGLLWVMGYRVANELILTVVYVPAEGLKKREFMREVGEVIASIRFGI